MKVIVLSVLAFAIFSTNAAPRASKDIAGDATKALEEILEKTPEPLVDIQNEQYKIDFLVEVGTIDVSNFKVEGVKNTQIVKMEYDESTSRLDYELNIGAISIYIRLTMDVSGLLTMVSYPIVSIGLTDLKATGYAIVDTESTPNQLTDFKSLFSLGGAEGYFINILNDDELSNNLTDYLNDKFTADFNVEAIALEPTISPMIQSYINSILQGNES